MRLQNSQWHWLVTENGSVTSKATPPQMHSPWSGFRPRPLVPGLVPALEPVADVAQAHPGVRPVDEPVVIREREVHHGADRDDVRAEVVLDDPRPFDERVRAED